VATVFDLLAVCRTEGVSWPLVAREAQRPGGLDRFLGGDSSERGPEAAESLRLLDAASGTLEERREWAEDVVRRARADGYGLTTVLDDGYPVNLRLVPDLPPFLFVRGRLLSRDAFSVAVVGTRQASGDGLARARDMARLLSAQGVTVLSGLARGIDTAAHEACLDAGWRTIAVLGSGIRRVYPPENRELAERIAEHGAVVSQFWPDAPPSSYNFPRRNVVTSGLGQGTIVIEAAATSGAKLQARLAVEHGKLVFLPRSLVTSQTWARKYLSRPRVYEVGEVTDVVKWLRSPDEQRGRVEHQAQLALAL
jgi:DNA processing protein